MNNLSLFAPTKLELQGNCETCFEEQDGDLAVGNAACIFSGTELFSGFSVVLWR